MVLGNSNIRKKMDILAIIGSMALMLYYAHQYIQKQIQTQSDRTDKLYEMFITLIKEGKNEK